MTLAMLTGKVCFVALQPLAKRGLYWLRRSRRDRLDNFLSGMLTKLIENLSSTVLHILSRSRLRPERYRSAVQVHLYALHMMLIFSCLAKNVLLELLSNEFSHDHDDSLYFPKVGQRVQKFRKVCQDLESRKRHVFIVQWAAGSRESSASENNMVSKNAEIEIAKALVYNMLFWSGKRASYSAFFWKELDHFQKI